MKKYELDLQHFSKTKTIKYMYHADVSLGHLQSSGQQ